MKKLLLLLIALLVLLSVAFSEELYIEQGTYVFQNDNLGIYINGMPTINDSWQGKKLNIPVVIENTGEKNCTVIVDNASLNDWACGCNLSGAVPAGKKKKSELQFDLDDTEVMQLKDLEVVEFSLHAYDTDNWFGEKVLESTPPIVLFVRKAILPDFDEKVEKADNHLLEVLNTGSTQYTDEEKAGFFDPSLLIWDDKKIKLSEEDWLKITAIYVNEYFDDGKGYIELGYDAQFTFKDSTLFADYDGTWLSLNRNPMAFYYLGYKEDKEHYLIRGYTPAVHNGIRTNIIIDFTDETPEGYLAGTVDSLSGKDMINLATSEMGKVMTGDSVQLVCKYISYNGSITETKLGKEIILEDVTKLANTPILGPGIRVTFCIVDERGNRYWTPLIETSPAADSEPEAEELRVGITGCEGVKVIQRRLKELGFYSGQINGDFGVDTEISVAVFQRANKLVSDGVVDTKTLDKMKSKEAVTLEQSGISKPKVTKSETVLYYNPDGGMHYHMDQNCKRVHEKYLPLGGQFTCAERNDEKYRPLTPCLVCTVSEDW